MSAQDALAAILSLEGGHALLRGDPLLLQRQYDLSDDELAMLTGASPAGYRVTRDSVRSKLRGAMAAWLPRTVAELAERHPGVWEEFLFCTVRRPRAGEEAAGPGEAEELVGRLASLVPGPLAEYARYELARATLSRDREAARAAQAAEAAQAAQTTQDVQETHTAQTTQAVRAQAAQGIQAAQGVQTTQGVQPTQATQASQAAQTTHATQAAQGAPAAQAVQAEAAVQPVLRVSEAVRIVEFGYDVTARGPIAELPAVRTRLLLRRRWHAPPATYRINDRTAALLARCDGTRDAGEVIAATGGDPVKAASVLEALLACGAVRPLTSAPATPGCAGSRSDDPASGRQPGRPDRPATTHEWEKAP